jgi:hypothetical protein
MPDLVTHLCAARILRRRVGAGFFPLFALGAVLPDIPSRPLHIIFPATYWFVAPFHSPLVCLLYCALLSLAFVPALRKPAFLCLCAGTALHLSLDLLQKQVCPVYFWFFPLSWKSWGIGLFWPDWALMALPLTIAVTAYVAWRERARGSCARL